MDESGFAAYMRARNLAEKTRMQRGYALKRIERAYGVDLDTEVERDGLASLLLTLTYGAADERGNAANPSKLDIDRDKLRTHLAWYRTHVVDYLRYRRGDASADMPSASDSENIEIIEDVVTQTFALEKDLQQALRLNISQLEKGMVIADGGSERRVEAGFIDILARDAAGVLTVIELKAETTRPEAVAQILAYMGCIAAETSEPVRGLLVGADHHPRVEFAVRALSNLQLRRYRYRFEFS